MRKILALTPSITDACSFYRSGGVFPMIEKITDCQIKLAQWDKVVLHWQNLTDYDLVMMQRPFEAQAVSVAKYLKDLSIPLWVDYDDNLLMLPAENPKFEVYDDAARENIETLLKMADVVSVTTKELKKSFDPYNKNVVIIPNAFNDFVFKERKVKPGRAQLIMWRGGDSHIKDVMLFRPVLDQVAKEHLDWHFLYMGWFPWFLEQGNNIYRWPGKDIFHYFTNVPEIMPAMMHVPLTDNLFNRCKSNIAFIEASFFGAVCLGPNWDEWNLPGMMNYADQQSYYDSIKALISGQVNITATNNMAWEYIRSELSLSKVNLERVQLINSLI